MQLFLFIFGSGWGKERGRKGGLVGYGSAVLPQWKVASPRLIPNECQSDGCSVCGHVLQPPAFYVSVLHDCNLVAFFILSLKQVFDALRTTMFILGMMCVFIGICLLAPDDTKGNLLMGVVNFKYIEDKDGKLILKIFRW